MFIKSKIQFFESKSQLNLLSWWSLSCCLSSQRYNFLKANHNFPLRYLFECYVVYQVKDTIFWKQITTFHLSYIILTKLFIKSKIQFFESKSQPPFTLIPIIKCCLSSQRYNFLKANHNGMIDMWAEVIVVYQVKDTIFWKQITTEWLICEPKSLLFIKSKIQFFESKSQLTFSWERFSVRCLSSQRYNFLKANHNHFHWGKNLQNVVYQVKDTIFWKQITTLLTS